MNLAPIIVFAYNRPEHLRKTLEALANNELADESVLYIYCDGSKKDATEEQDRKVSLTREVAHSAAGFKEIHVIERETNVGLKDNIVWAVTEVVNRYGIVIVFEDDMLTSPGTLLYFNEALNLYKDEEKVMHVVSYMFPHKYPLPETFFYPVPYPGGGWATWQRAWKYYSDDIDELYHYWDGKWKEFNYWNHYGNDLTKQLIDNYKGSLRTWFIRWYAIMHRMGGMTLYPGKSLVTNIGFDGSGENCFRMDDNPYWVENLVNHVHVRKKKDIRENWLASREIYAFHSGYWYNKRRRERFLRKFLKILRIY